MITSSFVLGVVPGSAKEVCVGGGVAECHLEVQESCLGGCTHNILPELGALMDGM